MGEQDVVTARYEGKKAIDLSRVRFATSPNSPALPAELHEESKTWKSQAAGNGAQSSYDVYAIYEGQVIGKLRVVSYPKQRLSCASRICEWAACGRCLRAKSAPQ